MFTKAQLIKEQLYTKQLVVTLIKNKLIKEIADTLKNLETLLTSDILIHITDKSIQ